MNKKFEIYSPNKHEVAQRLAELWHMREVNPKMYSRNRLGEEKEYIYTMYGSDDEIMRLARDYLLKR